MFETTSETRLILENTILKDKNTKSGFHCLYFVAAFSQLKPLAQNRTTIKYINYNNWRLLKIILDFCSVVVCTFSIL